jgi:hypothetical protein
MVFLYSAAIFFVGNLIYVIFGTAEIQPWNDLSNRNEIQAEDASENS